MATTLSAPARPMRPPEFQPVATTTAPTRPPPAPRPAPPKPKPKGELDRRVPRTGRPFDVVLLNGQTWKVDGDHYPCLLGQPAQLVQRVLPTETAGPEADIPENLPAPRLQLVDLRPRSRTEGWRR